MKKYFAYVVASKKNGVLYIEVTNDLIKRVFEHKNRLVKGFTAKYFAKKLVYFEGFDDIRDAIKREKQLKKWNRIWKIKLIEQNNPDWNDLYNELI